MANVTDVDQIIDFKDKAINLLGNSQPIVALITNNPNISLDSDEAYDVFERNLFDNLFIADTITEDGAFIMVDAARIKVPTSTVQQFELYAQIVVNSKYMDLDHSLFVGTRGNRLDNLARYTDLLLSGAQEFGLGRLMPYSIMPESVPKGFASVMLVYRPVDTRFASMAR